MFRRIFKIGNELGNMIALSRVNCVKPGFTFVSGCSPYYIGVTFGAWSRKHLFVLQVGIRTWRKPPKYPLLPPDLVNQDKLST
jgi:hypothetical protein